MPKDSSKFNTILTNAFKSIFEVIISEAEEKIKEMGIDPKSKQGKALVSSLYKKVLSKMGIDLAEYTNEEIKNILEKNKAEVGREIKEEIDKLTTDLKNISDDFGKRISETEKKRIRWEEIIGKPNNVFDFGHIDEDHSKFVSDIKLLFKNIVSVRTGVLEILENKINNITFYHNDLKRVGPDDHHPERHTLESHIASDLMRKITELINNPPRTRYVGGGGISSIIAGSGITATDDGLGHITISAPGSTTDELVKYDSGDPTAGYLSAKVVAGEGITLSEGVGVDENKLKISTTWLLDPVEEHWDITEGLPPDPEVGDRYISDGTDEELGWYDGYIYEWDGEEWEETIPIEGMMVWLIFEMVWWVFFSGGWMEVGSRTYVPYSGAIADVDLGSHNLTTTGTGTFGTLQTDTIKSNDGATSLFSWDGVNTIDVGQNLDLGFNAILAGGFLGDYYCTSSGTTLFYWDAVNSEIDVGQDLDLGGNTIDSVGWLYASSGWFTTSVITDYYYSSTGSTFLFFWDSENTAIDFNGNILNSIQQAKINYIIGGLGGTTYMKGDFLPDSPTNLGTHFRPWNNVSTYGLDMLGNIDMNSNSVVELISLGFANGETITNGTDGIIAFTSVGGTYNNAINLQLDSQYYNGVFTTAGGAGSTIAFNCNLTFFDDKSFAFGSSTDTRIVWITAPITDRLSIFVPGGNNATGGHMVWFTNPVGTLGMPDDFGHGPEINFKQYLHSQKRSSVATDEWGSLQHSRNYFLLESGKASIVNLGNTIIGDATNLGAEKITNGTFTGSAASWTLGTGWAYSNNTVIKNAAGTGTLSQTSAAMATPLVAGELYKLTYQLSGYSVAGATATMDVSCGGVNIHTYSAPTTFTTPAITITDYFVAKDTSDLVFTPLTAFRVTIDNVSLKKVSGGNLTVIGTEFIAGIKSGANQAAAGATAGELWKTASHATLPDNVLMIGV